MEPPTFRIAPLKSVKLIHYVFIIVPITVSRVGLITQINPSQP